jgi:type IV secretion system protein VirB6
MVCYGGDKSNCTNFFNYIKGLLTLYIISYGFMFLLGVVKITQTDLVIRVVKIGFVAGLMNETTFDFFNNNVFSFVTGFADSIISNIGGYSMFITNTNGTSISNPFTFMTALMTKIFFSKTFAAQMMAMIAMGISGVIYFIITFITLIMLIIVAFRAIAVYIMAFVALAVLIGIAPLFLTFMLFGFTFYLFDNWVKFTFRYMVEPVIMMAGIIILTQLFTIYLDYVTGYSVCWKCGLALKIPFPNIPGFNPAFLDVPIFCISWFAPWGFDHFSGVMGINMQHIISLMIIAYCLWGYIDFAGTITGRLVAASTGGPSATSMGKAMSGSTEQRALKPFGLDAKSRNEMKAASKNRQAALSKGANKNSLGGNRHDVKQNQSRGAGGSASGGGTPPPLPPRSGASGGGTPLPLPPRSGASGGGKLPPKPLPKPVPRSGASGKVKPLPKSPSVPTKPKQ